MVLTESATTQLGTPLPTFSLPGTDGQTYTPDDFSASQIVVVIFTCNHCPYAKLAKPKLEWLAQQYQNDEVALVAINSNESENYPEDSFDYMHRPAFDYPFPYLRDESQVVATAFDAVCTPDVFVYTAERTLAYRGQIDDERPKDTPRLTPQDAEYARDLRRVIDALRTNTPIPDDIKPSVGCSIKWQIEA